MSLPVSYFLFFLFFFQAEDGIRDRNVTGVQTCALPIFAETYDTLTADDTYRTPISSFEALTELRRVAGTQLDARYVETLSEVLAGRGVEYRHAREASFERELDLERRIGEAASS